MVRPSAPDRTDSDVVREYVRSKVSNACRAGGRVCRRTLIIVLVIGILASLVVLFTYGVLRVKYGYNHYYLPETFNSTITEFYADCNVYQPCLNTTCDVTIPAAERLKSTGVNSLLIFEVACGLHYPVSSSGCDSAITRLACQFTLSDDLDRWYRQVDHIGLDGQWNYNTGCVMITFSIVLTFLWAFGSVALAEATCCSHRPAQWW